MAKRLHGVEAVGKQGDADALAAGDGIDASRAEEAGSGRVVAGEADELAVVNRDKTGDGPAREGDSHLARPVLAEILPNPADDQAHFRRQGGTDRHLVGFCSALEFTEDRRIQAHQHVRHMLLHIFLY